MKQPEVIIIVRGGVVESVWSNENTLGVTVIDCDINGSDDGVFVCCGGWDAEKIVNWLFARRETGKASDFTEVY